MSISTQEQNLEEKKAWSSPTISTLELSDTQTGSVDIVETDTGTGPLS